MLFFFKKSSDGNWCKSNDALNEIEYFYNKANYFYKIVNDLSELLATEKEKNNHLIDVIKQFEKINCE